MTLSLDTPIQFIKGVGPVRATQLEGLGVKTLQDLLLYFPRRFDLRKQCQPIATLRGGEEAATVAGEVQAVNERASRMPFLEAFLRDDSGATIGAKWFHGGYLRDKIRPGMTLAVSGKVSVYREVLQMVNPRFQVIYDPQNTNLAQDELLPVYPASGVLSSGVISAVIKKVLPQAKGLIPEWYTPDYLALHGLMPRDPAVAAMHRPEDQQQWEAARRRLAYDECLVMQLGIAMMRLRTVSRPAHALPFTREIDQRIRARFPFSLTPAQDKAVAEIVSDLGRNHPMNRLLQGDVGAGKTVVALYAALLAVANRRQAVLMAPTEILAVQHYRRIQQYLEGSRVHTALLVGGQKGIDRERVLEGLASGTTNIVVGTHALLGEGVKFHQLALVIIDEQHKFGVEQRTGIRGKGFAPHYLVMTATPIPRTLAMTVFGDLDVSTIEGLPPGRGKTTTRVVAQEEMPRIMEAVAKRLQAGQHAYFIYPLVNPSPQAELTAAQDAYEELSRGPLGKYGVGLVHGQMNAVEKNDAMRRFASGEAKVLVASVVVEVGLDVPEANVMVIMHAERFGLAQLHQLRGRIGRSAEDAACYLVASPNNPTARQRLTVLEQTSDGFKIAEEDLRIRGPGEVFGTRQHGLPELKIVDLANDLELLRGARKDAFEIVEQDPGLNNPENQLLRQELQQVYAGRLGFLAGA